MSATTILDAYDTQMLDYSGDFDVAMQTAGSSSDAWLFNNESVMDQDAHHDSQSLGAPDNESVEVDMEGYPGADNESVEYEMADEEQVYQPEGGDLLDVEVYDASQAHSPMPIPAIDVPQVAPDNTVDYSIQPTPVFSDTHNDIAAPDPPPILAGVTHLYEPSNYEYPAADNASNPPTPFEDQQEVSDANVASTDSHSEHPVDPSTMILPTVTDDTTFHDSSGSGVFGEASESADKGVVRDVAHGEDSHSTPHGDEAESGTISSHPQDHEEAAHSEEPHESAAVSADTAEPYQLAEYHNEAPEYSEVFASVSDPHEISEGIYIDPPPAVLLSLPSSDVIYLFNQPSTRAGSNSPTEETPQSVQHIPTVLLHRRPTLYYESLINVFEALRQEEYIAHIPELAEGELALDAYDLQLVVSEDNVHARDVTLHDLNVLHDGSDLPGPLRLHLHVVIPRFILRYHMLRDQIARLNLVAEGGDSEQVVPHEDHYGENAEVYHQQDQDNEDKPEQYPEPTDENPPDSAESAEQTNEAPGDISNLTAEDHDYHQVRGEEAQALEDRNENADADTATEVHEGHAGENLSADAFHDEDSPVATRLGDGEPTEYEEYAEAEEYDERYGETLLEEGSGDTPDNDQTLEYPEATEHQEPAVADETQESLSEADGLQSLTAVGLAEQGDESAHAPEGYLTVGDVEADLSEETHTNDDELDDHDDQDHGSEDTISKHGVAGPDELDSNFVAVHDHVANLTDPIAETPTSETQEHQEQDQEYPELPDDAEWDDDLDGEGDIDEEWSADPDDRVSNQSSVTLSSIASSKRGHDEVDFDNEDDDEPSPHNSSPEPKRPRVR